VRYYLDEDVKPEVAGIGRNLGLDIVSSHEVGRNALTDADQLLAAAAEGRCLVTRNRDDFLGLSMRFLAEGSPHAGVLIVPYSMPNDRPVLVVRALLAHSKLSPAMPAYMVDFLGHAETPEEGATEDSES